VIKYAIKNSGEREPFQIKKIRKQTEFGTQKTNITAIEFEAALNFPNKEAIKTTHIQEIVIKTAVNKISIEEPEWDYIAGRSNMFYTYTKIFKLTKLQVQEWQEHIKYLIRNNYYRSDIGEYLENLNEKQIKYIDKVINNNNHDWDMTYAQTEILKSKYTIKNKKGLIEYPILADIANALILSRGDKHFEHIFSMIHYQYISLATPFKRNLRRPDGNVGSCFIGENIDSLGGLMKAWADMASISKEGGGIGWYLGKVRPEDTYSYKIVKANNITKWVKIINDIAIAVNQGGARPGAVTIGLDWWHMDINSFLEIKSELTGDLRDKAFDIFPQVIVDSWFVEKKENDEDVYLFNHYEYQKKFGIDVTELVDEELYNVHQHVEEMILDGKWHHYTKINSKELWKKIMWTWVEIGDMYISSKDNLNKSNYLKYDPDGGIAKQGNLCVESYSFSKAATKWKEEYDGEKRTITETNGRNHACNLCSVNYTNLVNKTDEFIEKVYYYAVRILDKSIDEGTMPVLEAELLSKEIRNVGVGFVGVGDMMAYNNKLYDTEDGQLFLEQLIEKAGYFSYKASIELSKEFGSYPLFKAENYNKVLGYYPEELNKMSPNKYDWVSLQKDILKFGIRNFYINAGAPNSSTAILIGASASYLPVYNKEMVQTLGNLSLPILPKFIKSKYWSYKTKFQYHPKDIIEATRKCQKWIDTGLSMEININPDICKINEISDAILEGFIKKELKAVYYSLTIGGNKSDGCSDCAN